MRLLRALGHGVARLPQPALLALGRVLATAAPLGQAGGAVLTVVIEGDGRLIATAVPKPGSDWSRGDRVFHVKFGYGQVSAIEGNKLTVNFEKAGEKKVIDSFVEKQG